MQSQFDITRNHSTRKFNQEAWRFWVQVFFSGTVLALCILKIASPGPGDDKNIALYWGGLSSVLAYWLPSPGQNKEDKEQMSSSLMATSLNGGNNPNDSVALLAQSTNTTEHKS
ncbi:hypothetical protein H6G76_06315 [Nostoc sp. FACHB-152]|uniref:hypothetical protein n=1 Tax=unclassified Nostoc TaxID=2593658 RepID=UPI00168A3523|nr:MULTISPECIES: hypothetical protein [unclassified Nostoc]MBD2446786.1 hypothetical protein [Nostoc sp. FACHB-152]MBD2466633.1 hypothetical protein [Nostoc sp. FACHB-145]